MLVTYTYIIRSHSALLQQKHTHVSTTTTITTTFSVTYFSKSTRMRDLPACSASTNVLHSLPDSLEINYLQKRAFTVHIKTRAQSANQKRKLLL